MPKVIGNLKFTEREQVLEIRLVTVREGEPCALFGWGEVAGLADFIKTLKRPASATKPCPAEPEEEDWSDLI